MNTKIFEDCRLALLDQRGIIDDAIVRLDTVIAMNGHGTVPMIIGPADVGALKFGPLKVVDEPKARRGRKPKVEKQKRKYTKRDKVEKGSGAHGGASALPLRPTREASVPVSARANFAAIPRTAKMVDAIRAVAGKLDKDGTFTRASMAAEIVKGWPALQPKIGTLSIYLLDMMERGELKRKGSGTDAVYSVGKLKAVAGGEDVKAPGPSLPNAGRITPPEQMQAKWQDIRGEIQVPRELED